MCIAFCKELKGWCKSFTRTEAALTAAEACLLLIFILGLIFLIAHLIVCSPSNDLPKVPITDSITVPISHVSTSDTTKHSTTKRSTPARASISISKETRSPPVDVTCTWIPSDKTEASTHYYEGVKETKQTTTKQTTHRDIITTQTIEISTKGYFTKLQYATTDEVVKTLVSDDLSDGEEPEDAYKDSVLALVKIKPNRDIVFGCILTIVADYWTLTAASCIEAIEEVDALEAFVMMEHWGRAGGRAYRVSDVQSHPRWGASDSTESSSTDGPYSTARYDVAMLRSEDKLTGPLRSPARLPSLVDYHLITIGEHFTILGFGGFRSAAGSQRQRELRAMSVFTCPWQQCAGGEGAWGRRHLWGGAPLRAGAPAGPGPMCAGVLSRRGPPCLYCAGTPLLRGRHLLALMADNPHCAMDCEPAYYVNIAALADWIIFVIETDE